MIRNGAVVAVLKIAVMCFVVSTVTSASITTGYDVQQQLNSTSSLLQALFGHGDAQFRRFIKPPDTAIVNISLELDRIITINEVTQVITIAGVEKLNWINENLQWNIEDYGGVKDIRVPLTNVWVPDVVLWNSVADQYEQILPQVMANLYFNGHTVLIQPAVYLTVCSLDIYEFPFDKHICSFSFGSWSYPHVLFKFSARSLRGETGRYNKNNIWRLLSFTAEEKFVYHEGGDGKAAPYSVVDYHVRFERRYTFPIVFVIIPLMLVTAMCFVGFLLPCESNEKAGLNITVFLTLIMYLLILYQDLPYTAHTPIIVQYLLATMLQSAFSLVVIVVDLHIHHSGKNDNETMVPLWLRVFFLNKLGKLFGYGNVIIPDAEHMARLSADVERFEVQPDKDDVVIDTKVFAPRGSVYRKISTANAADVGQPDVAKMLGNISSHNNTNNGQTGSSGVDVPDTPTMNTGVNAKVTGSSDDQGIVARPTGTSANVILYEYDTAVTLLQNSTDKEQKLRSIIAETEKNTSLYQKFKNIVHLQTEDHTKETTESTNDDKTKNDQFYGQQLDEVVLKVQDLSHTEIMDSDKVLGNSFSGIRHVIPGVLPSTDTKDKVISFGDENIFKQEKMVKSQLRLTAHSDDRKKSVWLAPDMATDFFQLPSGIHVRKCTISHSDLKENLELLYYRIFKIIEDYQIKLAAKERKYAIITEWRQVAMTFDRLFFIVYSIMTIVFCWYIFANFPFVQENYIL